MSLKGQGPASLQLPGEQVGPLGLLDVLLWMLWQQLLCSIYNSQISETLHSKQIALPNSLPKPGTTEGRCLVFLEQFPSWRTRETASAYHWSRTKAIICHLPITCLGGGGGIRTHQAGMGGH